MTDDERGEIRAHMDERLAELDDQISGLEATSQPVAPDKALGRLTRLDEMNAQSVKLAALRQARDERARLRRALARVDSPRFGLCAGCRQPIPVERIKAVPDSPFCVGCAGR